MKEYDGIEDTMILQGELIADAENEKQDTDAVFSWGVTCFLTGVLFGSILSIIIGIILR